MPAIADLPEWLEVVVRYGLGVDGGGSATRWALSDEAGMVLRRGELPPVSGLLSDPVAHAGMVRLAAALPDALGSARPDAVLAGITGLSERTPEAEATAALLGAALGISAAAIRVRNDVWIAYRAVWRPGEGNLVYAGTGSVALHLRADGSAVQLGGHGHLVDDAGGAFWIGQQALRLTFRALDADPDWTSNLAEEIYHDVGGRTWPAVRSHVYADGRARVAMLARAVARAAVAGDGAALAILTEAGEHLARLARTLERRVGRLPIAVLGRAASLHPAIMAAMQTALPGVEVTRREPDIAAAAAQLAAGSAD